MTAPLLRIEHLEVRYGDLIGVSDVSLEVVTRAEGQSRSWAQPQIERVVADGLMAPTVATLTLRFQARIDGCARSCATDVRTRARATARMRGVRSVQLPGESTGPTPCHTGRNRCVRRTAVSDPKAPDLKASSLKV